MFSLILLLLVATGISFLSLQNTQLVSLSFVDYTVSDVPLYVVIIGSLLGGILLAYVMYIVHAISAGMTIRGQKKKLKQERQEVAELTKKVHQLELENVRLKKDHEPEQLDLKSL